MEYAIVHSVLARVLEIGQVSQEEGPVDSDEETNAVQSVHSTKDTRILVYSEIQKPLPTVPVESTFSIYNVFDSHFHLDRTSKRLYRDPVALTMDCWLSQQMERPPGTPVNLKGGLVIYCDPDSYPETIPFHAKWKVAVGLHPK